MAEEQKKILATIVNNLDPDKYDIDILEMEHFDKPMPKLREGINILKPYKSKKHSSIAEAIIYGDFDSGSPDL